MMYHFSVEDRTGEETVDVAVETPKDEEFAAVVAWEWARETFSWIEFDGYVSHGTVATLPIGATLVLGN